MDDEADADSTGALSSASRDEEFDGNDDGDYYGNRNLNGNDDDSAWGNDADDFSVSVYNTKAPAFTARKVVIPISRIIQKPNIIGQTQTQAQTQKKQRLPPLAIKTKAKAAPVTTKSLQSQPKPQSQPHKGRRILLKSKASSSTEKATRLNAPDSDLQPLIEHDATNRFNRSFGSIPNFAPDELLPPSQKPSSRKTKPTDSKKRREVTNYMNTATTSTDALHHASNGDQPQVQVHAQGRVRLSDISKQKQKPEDKNDGTGRRSRKDRKNNERRRGRSENPLDGRTKERRRGRSSGPLDSNPKERRRGRSSGPLDSNAKDQRKERSRSKGPLENTTGRITAATPGKTNDGSGGRRSKSSDRLQSTSPVRRREQGYTTTTSKEEKSHRARSRSPGALTHSKSPGALTRTGLRREKRSAPRRTKSMDIDFSKSLLEAENDPIVVKNETGAGRRIRLPSRSKSSDLELMVKTRSNVEEDGTRERRRRPPGRSKSSDMEGFLMKKPELKLGNALKFVENKGGSSSRRSRGDTKSVQSEGTSVSTSSSRRRRKSPSSRSLKPDSSRSKSMSDKLIEEEARVKQLREEAQVLEQKRLTEEAKLYALREEAKQFEQEQLLLKKKLKAEHGSC